MGVSFMSILMILLSGGGELLDYVPSDMYWKSKNIEMNVQTITAELDGAKDDAGKAGAVRKLMAIRALGELKDKAALATLEKQVDSKEMFVAEYAKRAIGIILDKPMPEPAAAELKDLREKDLWMLPAQCGGVAQAVLRGAAKPDIKKAMAAMPFPHQNTPDGKDEAVNKMIQSMIDLADQIGNVRLDLVTIGLSQEVGDRQGFFVLLARGTYDHTAVKGIMPQGQVETIGELEFTLQGNNGAMATPSDELFIMCSGASKGDMPLDDIATAVKEGKGKLHDNEDLGKLIQVVDRSQMLWAVAKMSNSYKQAPVIAAFDSIQLVGKQDAKQLVLELKGVGSDADVVKAATEQLTALLEQAKQSLPPAGETPAGEAKPEGADAKPAEGAAQTDAAKAGTQPLMDFLNSVQIKADGTTATLSATAKGSSFSMLLLPLMMGM